MQNALNNIIISYLQPFAGFLILTGVLVVGIQLIVNAHRPKERSQTMTSLFWVGIGGIIIGLIISLGSMIVNMSQSIVTGLTGNANGSIAQTLSAVKDDTSFISNIICTLIDGLAAGLSAISNSLASLLYGSTSTSGSSFEIGDVLFASYDKWFPDSMITTINALMALIAVGVIPLIIIAITKVGVQLTLSPLNLNLRKDASESVSRWFFSIALIGFAPIFVIANIQINGALVSYLKDIVTSNGVTTSLGLGDIQTGSQILTSLVKLTFSILTFYMITLFEIRKIMVIIFLVFTPIAAVLWAITKNTMAASIWIGEMLSNIYMQFFYAFVFTIYSFLARNGTLNWFQTIIWMFMLVTVSEALRNSLQGLYTRLSGVNEASIPGKLAGGALAILGISSSYKAAKTTFGNSGNFRSAQAGSSNESSSSPSVSSGSTEDTTNAGIYGLGNADMAAASGTAGSAAQSTMSSYSKVKEGDLKEANTVNLQRNPSLIMDAQRKMVNSIAGVNAVSNIIGRAVSIPLTAAAFPLGVNAINAAAGVGKVISGGIRAVGTPIAMAGAALSNAKKHEMSFSDSYNMMTNSTSKIGSVMKTASITSSNISNDHSTLEKTFEQMRPDNEKQFVRWNYCPASADIDHFRYTDKAVTPSDYRTTSAQKSTPNNIVNSVPAGMYNRRNREEADR